MQVPGLVGSRLTGLMLGAVSLLGLLGSACKELLNPEERSAGGATAVMDPTGAGGAALESSSGGAATGGAAGASGFAVTGGVSSAGQPPGAGAGMQGLLSDAGQLPPDGTEPPNCPRSEEFTVPPLRLTLVTGGLEAPVLVTAPPGDRARLFVVEKPGRIRVISGGALLAEPFLDISDSVAESVEEMGLLGLAFHPRFAENRLFYVTYSADPQGGFNPAHTWVLEEYAADGENPDRALPTGRRLLEIPKPEGNHNGGNLAFGPDALLYIGTGDGGGGGDAHGEIGNGQSLGTLLGKLLRIDVDGRGSGPFAQYAVPAGNLFEQSAAALPEIWSIGLRNPWRFSFDSCSGDLYIGDVGQEGREEIDFQPAFASAGHNYGWRLMEAELCYEPDSGCDAAAQAITLPIASYGRDVGQAITGGYVYRGELIPELRGTYLYADYQSAAFFALRTSAGALEAAPVDISGELNPERAVGHIASFGQDAAGELYVVSFDGELYRIDPE